MRPYTKVTLPCSFEIHRSSSPWKQLLIRPFTVPMSTYTVQKLVLVQDLSSYRTYLRPFHAFVIVNGLHQNFALVAKLLRLCSSCSTTNVYASTIFAQVRRPNVFLWNTLLKVYSKSSNPIDTVVSYVRFCKEGHRPDHYTFPPLLEACAQLLALSQGLQIHTHLHKFGLVSNVCTQTQLLRFLAECGCVGSARRVFDEIDNRFRDEVAWTAMISAYSSEHGDVYKAFRLFKEMPFERDPVCWNAMMSGFIRWGEIRWARELFEEFPEKDLFCWTAMIGGYVQIGEFSEALNLFNQMRVSYCKPNRITLVSALCSCAHLGAIRRGMSIHEYIEKNGIFVDVYIGTTLVDMYSKCGNIESSMKVFDLLSQRDVYAWNTMIEGLAIHGLARHAIDMFSKMQEEGFKPNEVTFVGLLTACSHMGLVKEGETSFDRMINEYGIAPRIEHYGCMVDLFGRAGLLDKAEKLVNSMPFEPSAVVWGALLSACKVKGNVVLGERAMKHLLDLEPHNSCNYILLSNIYAAENRWDDVEEAREMLRASGIKKIYGFSYLEIGGLVYEFVQGDKSLPKDIYEFLDKLTMWTGEMGHIPQTREVMHNIEE